MMPPHLMKGHSSQVILLASGSELVLFNIHGLQLAAFQDHRKRITSLWVVSVAPAPPMPQSPAPGPEPRPHLGAPPWEPPSQLPVASHFKDQSRVITSSFDLSLRVYVWNKDTKRPVLDSRYHLLGGSHRWAR